MVIHSRNDPVRLFGKRLLLLVLLIFVVAAISGVWNAYQKERESAALRAQSQGQLADLSERQAQLNADIAKLKTDRGMEEALREQYALAAHGEHLIVIVDPASSTPVRATSSAFARWLHKAFPWW